MWIDARDEMPKIGEPVLVYWEQRVKTRSLKNYSLGYYDGDCWVCLNSHGLPVSHWMELPAPPSERKPKPQTARTCGTCKNWQDGSCNLPRSPRFTDTTSATDGCTPNKKARADWI